MNPIRVLLIEDDECDAEIVVRALRASDAAEYSVEIVARLADAFRNIFQNSHDIILLDLGLPDGMDLSGLSHMAAMLDSPVIVLTGNEDPSLVDRALACGAHDFLPKSENLRAMLPRAIQFALHRHRTQTPEVAIDETQTEFSRLQSSRLREKLEVAGRLATFAEETDQFVAIINDDYRIEWANDSFVRRFQSGDGRTTGESIRSCVSDAWLNAVCGAVDRSQNLKLVRQVNKTDGPDTWVRVELRAILQDCVSKSRYFLAVAEETLPSPGDISFELDHTNVELEDTVIM